MAKQASDHAIFRNSRGREFKDSGGERKSAVGLVAGGPRIGEADTEGGAGPSASERVTGQAGRARPRASRAEEAEWRIELSAKFS
jgi:hypothetical protein